MDWFIQHHSDGVDHLSRFQSRDEAIVKACRLLDAGWDVSGIGFQTLDNAVLKQDIDNIYSIWVSAKGTFETGT